MTLALRAARNAASIARADDGAGSSALHLYDAPGGTLLAVRRLATPCGSVRAADSLIELAPHADNDLAAVSGAAAWGEWIAADGEVLATGLVTDQQGHVSDGAGGTTDTGDIGPFVLAGTAGTTLYEGGTVLLATALIG